jgi:hypothetical protein
MLIAAGISLSAVFAVACWLTPDPRGFGTHQQLGLPECNFRSVTGVNCPHCGMTTSFCFLVRGNLKGAWQANPCGILLAAILTVLTPWCFYVGATGHWALTDDPMTWAVRTAIVYIVIAAMIWIIRSTLW